MGFSEDPLTLKPGDDLPGRFNVVVSTPGQQTFTVGRLEPGYQRRS